MLSGLSHKTFADRPDFSHDLFLIDYSQLAVLELKFTIDKYSLHIRFSRGINQVGEYDKEWQTGRGNGSLMSLLDPFDESRAV